MSECFGQKQNNFASDFAKFLTKRVKCMNLDILLQSNLYHAIMRFKFVQGS